MNKKYSPLQWYFNLNWFFQWRAGCSLLLEEGFWACACVQSGGSKGRGISQDSAGIRPRATQRHSIAGGSVLRWVSSSDHRIPWSLSTSLGQNARHLQLKRGEFCFGSNFYSSQLVPRQEGVVGEPGSREKERQEQREATHPSRSHAQSCTSPTRPPSWVTFSYR